MTSRERLMKLQIPKPYRCCVCITFDTDMANGYSPTSNPGCDGRTAGFVADTMRRLMDTAERFDMRLHWFKIANGLEEGNDWSVYCEALERGHHVDSHTYSHLNLAYTDPGILDADLRRANDLLKSRLDVDPVVLRGPGGYPAGDLPAANRQVILDSGFRYVSGEFNAHVEYREEPFEAVHDPLRHPPFRFPDGLIEIPIHGWTDRAFFDVLSPRPEALREWRAEYGHKPVPTGWRCPWTDPGTLDRFLEFHKKTLDVVYENRGVFDFGCHPYSFYLHDRDNVFLQEFLTHIRSKPQPVWIGTLRDLMREVLHDQGEEQPCRA